jgi:hypothetical protein
LAIVTDTEMFIVMKNIVFSFPSAMLGRASD